MAVVLFRVDERLIHGQVVVGWGSELHPNEIVVVDDELTDSRWEQELYTLGLPSGIEVSFVGVADARRQLDAWRRGERRVILLTRDVATMWRLAEGGGMRGEQVNIGGIHYAPGRRAALPYVYLSGDEEVALANLAEEGVTVAARDLPGSRAVDIAELLRRDPRER